MTTPSNLFAKYNIDEYDYEAEAKAERKEDVSMIENDEM